MRRRSTARGFTLVELVVVVAIVGMMSALMATGMERSHRYATVEMSRATVESRFQQAIDHFRRVLAIARVDDPFDSGTKVRHQVPVDHDGDGLAYDATGAVTFGWSSGGVATIGAAAWFAFVADSVVTETGLDLDVNKDGDKADAYDLGHLEQQLPDGKILRLTGSSVLQKQGDPGGDFDENGTLDPLFEVTDTGRSRLARLRVFGLYRLADGRWQRLDCDASVRLQNDET